MTISNEPLSRTYVCLRTRDLGDCKQLLLITDQYTICQLILIILVCFKNVSTYMWK